MNNAPGTKLQLSGISKSFPGVKALQEVSLSLLQGEVHVLCGENGAGKSTLMHILAGNLQPDEGTILLNGKETIMEGPLEAIEKGIAIVYQERSLTEELSVAENIFANRQPRSKLGLIQFERMYGLTRALLKRLSLDNIAPASKVKFLSAAQKQMVEIAKALSITPAILILDEPTASITEIETRLLFGIIRELKARGVSIIYISHRMEEIFKIGDRISILKDGRYQGTFPLGEITQELLIRKMTGRDVSANMTAFSFHNAIALEVKNLSGPKFNDVSFQLHKGEILALSGLVGAGRTEIARSIFGAAPPSSGSIAVNGRPVTIGHPFDAITHGIGYIPEDRKEQGLFLQMTMEENMLSGRRALSRKGGNTSSDDRTSIRDLVRRLKISPPNTKQKAINLSGGNQQKVVLAKWLLLNPRIIIADEPTHGIDVGSKFEIYRLLQQLAKDGAGILLISSELPEVLTLAHRILVIHNGRIAAKLSREEATEESILHYASGIKNMFSDL